MTYVISNLETSICGSKFSIKLVCKSMTPSWSLMVVPISKVPFSWLFFSILESVKKLAYAEKYEPGTNT